MISEKIIKRYLEGKATRSEFIILKTYFKSEDLSILEKWMERDWSQDGEWDTPLPPGLSEEMLRHIKMQLEKRKSKIASLRPTKTFWKIASVAAILVVFIGIGLWLSQPFYMETYSTGFAEWKNVDLPDGSVVKLNANSELKCAKSWEKGATRVVWMKGEAFFQVKKKILTGSKFQVVTKDLTIEVLGTSFNVNSRFDNTEVYLNEGKIELDLGTKKEILNRPGDFVSYSATEKNIVKILKQVEPEVHTSWKDGVLIMKDKSGAEIFERIKDIYGVEILLENETVLEQVKTVSVPMDKLEIAIPLLEGTFNTVIKMEGNRLIIQ